MSRGRVPGRIEAHDPTPGMGEHDEDEEDLERNRGHNEEVDGDEVLQVIVEGRQFLVALQRGFGSEAAVRARTGREENSRKNEAMRGNQST